MAVEEFDGLWLSLPVPFRGESAIAIDCTAL
jgi:hypothetical protein